MFSVETLGRHAWTVLHYEAAQGNRQRVDEILRNYPCNMCKTHVQTIRQTIPFFEEVPHHELVRWVYLLHNRVNLDLKKELLPWEKVGSTAYREAPNESIEFLKSKM